VELAAQLADLLAQVFLLLDGQFGETRQHDALTSPQDILVAGDHGLLVALSDRQWFSPPFSFRAASTGGAPVPDGSKRVFASRRVPLQRLF